MSHNIQVEKNTQVGKFAEISQLSASYGRKQILFDVNIPRLKAGELVGIIGPNAAGKSTLFKSLAGLLPIKGNVEVAGKQLKNTALAQWSNIVGMMPQQYNVQIALSVFESVLLALKSHGDWRVSEENLQAVAQTLEMLNISHLSERKIYELSGGQQQMVAMARLLVRDLPMILFDEPTSALDLHHQLNGMQTIKQVTQQRQIISLIALHDLNLAATFCDRLVLIQQGKIMLDGLPQQVLSHSHIEQVYNVNVELGRTPRGTWFVDAFLP